MGGKVEWGGGKPFPGIFNACAERLHITDRSKACLVGDTLRTDILGARDAGFKSILVTETGVTADLAAKNGVTFEDLYAREETTPDFTLSRVGVKAPAP
jgi:ribonucleotide monophosphatase NagD (HAD superfamily)